MIKYKIYLQKNWKNKTLIISLQTKLQASGTTTGLVHLCPVLSVYLPWPILSTCPAYCKPVLAFSIYLPYSLYTFHGLLCLPVLLFVYLSWLVLSTCPALCIPFMATDQLCLPVRVSITCPRTDASLLSLASPVLSLAAGSTESATSWSLLCTQCTHSTFRFDAMC